MDFLKFIQDYYYLVILILFIIILSLELLILLIKKKDPSVLSGINSILPSLVQQAEVQFGAGNGDAKFLFVCNSVRDYLSSVFNIQNFDSYKNYVKSKVEEILSCPQKKEV